MFNEHDEPRREKLDFEYAKLKALISCAYTVQPDQRPCFRFTDSSIHLFKSEMSSFLAFFCDITARKSEDWFSCVAAGLIILVFYSVDNRSVLSVSQ